MCENQRSFIRSKHFIMVSSAVAVALALACAGAASAADLPDAQDVIDKHIKATGGEDAFRKLETQVSKATFKLSEMGMEGTMTTYKAKGGKSLTQVEFGAFGTITSGTNGGVSWQMNPMEGNTVREGQEMARELRSAEFNVFLNWKAHFEKAQCVGEESVDGAQCYKVVMTPSNDDPVSYFFDKKSGLLLKQQQKLTEVPGGTETITFSNYKKVNGISVPHKVAIDAVEATFEITFDSIEFNVDIPPDRFDLPEEVKVLVKKAG